MNFIWLVMSVDVSQILLEGHSSLLKLFRDEMGRISPLNRMATPQGRGATI